MCVFEASLRGVAFANRSLTACLDIDLFPSSAFDLASTPYQPSSSSLPQEFLVLALPPATTQRGSAFSHIPHPQLLSSSRAFRPGRFGSQASWQA